MVSKAFYEALAQGDYDALRTVADEPDLDAIAQRRGQLLQALAGAEQFSHATSGDHPEYALMTRAILAEETRAAEIFADQWMYLMTRSWLTSKTRLFLDKLYAAGAKAQEYGASVRLDIVEYGGSLKRELIKEVLPKGVEPPSVITGGLIRKVGIKWLVYGGVRGGATAGGWFIGGPLGAAGGVVVSRPMLPAIRAFDHKGFHPRADQPLEQLGT